MIQLFPSLIAANLLNLEKELAQLDPYVDGYHIDVMDFHFVPNLTLGPDTINAIRKATQKPLYVHFMVEYPERYFERVILQQGDIVAVHPESPSSLPLDKLVHLISSYGWIPSLALNPETSSSILKKVSAPFNHLLLMSVHPGFSGQEFMPLVLLKLQEAINIGKESHKPYVIAIDGGIDQENVQALVKAGADQLIIGSAVFSGHNPVFAIKALRSSLMAR